MRSHKSGVEHDKRYIHGWHFSFHFPSAMGLSLSYDELGDIAEVAWAIMRHMAAKAATRASCCRSGGAAKSSHMPSRPRPGKVVKVKAKGFGFDTGCDAGFG